MSEFDVIGEQLEKNFKDTIGKKYPFLNLIEIGMLEDDWKQYWVTMTNNNKSFIYLIDLCHNVTGTFIKYSITISRSKNRTFREFKYNDENIEVSSFSENNIDNV